LSKGSEIEFARRHVYLIFMQQHVMILSYTFNTNKAFLWSYYCKTFIPFVCVKIVRKIVYNHSEYVNKGYKYWDHFDIHLSNYVYIVNYQTILWGIYQICQTSQVNKFSVSLWSDSLRHSLKVTYILFIGTNVIQVFATECA
jgi:hypothetical protein